MRDLTVGGRPLSGFGLTLKSFSTPPPSPKQYLMDVPGGDGVIDQTEFGGDVAYANREHEFVFYLVNPRDYEKVKSEVFNYLHGRAFDYALSWDEGYVYHGRFSVSEAPENTGIAYMTVKASAAPYKSKGTVTWLVNAAGGVVVNLPCGRKRQCPKIEVQRTSLVAFEGRTWQLEPGTHEIRDLWLTQGDNELVVNTYSTYGDKTWADYDGLTWADVADKRWYELAAGDDPVQVSDSWEDYDGLTWADVADKRWIEMAHPAEPGDEYSVYIQYSLEDI